MTYWYVPGMMYPYWELHTPPPTARNADSDTDMGDLTVDEFFAYFPHAYVISRQEYESRSITPDEGLRRARDPRLP